MHSAHEVVHAQADAVLSYCSLLLNSNQAHPMVVTQQRLRQAEQDFQLQAEQDFQGQRMEYAIGFGLAGSCQVE